MYVNVPLQLWIVYRETERHYVSVYAQDSWIVYVPFPLLAYEWLHALSNMNIFHSVQGHPRCSTV